MPTSGARPLWPLYVGGFLGPFGGALTNAILPEVAEGLGTDVAGAASAVTWYMLPFSLLMLVSGTIGARWGAARVARLGFLLYALASLLCLVATQLTPFLAGRALQGAANAFTTPLLVALISRWSPPERLGRSLGAFASLQAAGQAFSPLIGGLAAEWTYRAAFGAAGLVGLLLMVLMPRGEKGSETTGADWRALVNRRLAVGAVTAFCGQFSATALMILAGLVAADRFGLSSGERGVLVASFGVAGLVFGRLIGRLTDRFGLARVGGAGLLLLGASVTLVAVTPWLAVLAALTAAGGTAATGHRVFANSLALRSTPTNRSGATSVSMSLQFLGTAMVPSLIPLYHASPLAACAVAGVVALVPGVAYLMGREARTNGRATLEQGAESAAAAP